MIKTATRPQWISCHLRSYSKWIVAGRQINNHSSLWRLCIRKIRIGGLQSLSTSLTLSLRTGKRVSMSLRPTRIVMLSTTWRLKRRTVLKSFRREASKWCKLISTGAEMREVDWEMPVCSYQLSKCNNCRLGSEPTFPRQENTPNLLSPTLPWKQQMKIYRSKILNQTLLDSIKRWMMRDLICTNIYNRVYVANTKEMNSLTLHPHLADMQVIIEKIVTRSLELITSFTGLCCSLLTCLHASKASGIVTLCTTR